jgi:uncharacterized delta-60 repeat protein
VWTLDQAITYIQAGTWPVAPGPYWIGTVGAASSSSVGKGVAIDSSNNIYFVGYGNGYQPSNNSAVQIFKFNKSGSIQLQKRLGGNYLSGGFSTAVDSSGNLYVTGYYYDSTPQTLILIAKYNSSGTLQWQKTLGNSSQIADGRGIAVDSSGNSYIVGYSNAAGTKDIIIAKYNTSGVIQWQNRLASTSYDDIGLGIAVDSSGNSYIAGQGNTSGGAYTFFTAKYNTSGTIQWQREILGDNFPSATSIAVDSAGNSYVCGYTNPSSLSQYVILIAKYNTSGTLQWQRKYFYLSSADSVYGYGISVDSSGNIYAIGTSNIAGIGNNFVIIKLDNSGSIQWSRVLGAPSVTDEGNGIQIDSLGNICVVGYTTNSGAQYFLFAKFPSDGSLTGTYTVGSQSISYADGGISQGASSYGAQAGSLSAIASALTDSVPTLGDATISLTPSVTTL